MYIYISSGFWVISTGRVNPVPVIPSFWKQKSGLALYEMKIPYKELPDRNKMLSGIPAKNLRKSDLPSFNRESMSTDFIPSLG